MNWEEIKLAQCGCGSEAEVLCEKIPKGYSDSGTWYYVSCVGCATSTREFRTIEEAIETWNIAMRSTDETTTRRI